MRLGPIQIGGTNRVPADLSQKQLIRRHVLLKTPWFSLCLHEMTASDYDRALHDHPWPFISLVLREGYTEEVSLPIGAKTDWIRTSRVRWKDGRKIVLVTHSPGDILFRPATHRHRVIVGPRHPWTLILMGPRIRRWGFWIDGKWCWWRKHDNQRNICGDEVLHSSGGN